MKQLDIKIGDLYEFIEAKNAKKTKDGFLKVPFKLLLKGRDDWEKSSFFYKKESTKSFKIKTELGREFEGADDHILMIDPDKDVGVFLKDIKVGDSIPYLNDKITSIEETDLHSFYSPSMDISQMYFDTNGFCHHNTHTVKTCFNQNWGASPLRKEGWIYTFDKGSVGKSLSALTAYLYSHRDREVIVLDDCDGFLKSGGDDVMNLLKGVLDTENTLENLQPISTDPNIRSLGGKYITPRPKKDTLAYKPVRECRIDSHFDGAEFIVNVNGQTFREVVDKGPQLPESFTFSSRLIMISNLSPKDIDDAFRSRCTVYALTLTHKEFAAHLSKIVSGMMEELETRLDKNLVRQIRDTVYEWFVSLIELEGKEIFGRKVVIKCPLQFRLIPDFAQFFYVAMMSYIQKYKNDLRQVPSEKKFEVIAQGIQPRVILQMLDTLSDSVYIAKK